MNHNIYYFSGTGNSLHVVNQLVKNTGATPKPILLEKEGQLSGKVGFVFPVHINKLPWPFVEFINNQDFSKVEFLYAISTHGGIPGKVAFYLNHLLMQKECSLDAYHAIEMINNTPKGVAPKILMKLNWENDITTEKINTMVQRTNREIDLISEEINGGNKNFPALQKNNKVMFWDKLLWRIGGQPKLEFIVDDTCTKCGICEEVCLNHRIKVTDQVQYLKDECYYCYACFNYCKEQAILVKHYEKKMGRYHHPTIGHLEISNQKK